MWLVVSKVVEKGEGGVGKIRTGDIEMIRKAQITLVAPSAFRVSPGLVNNCGSVIEARNAE